MIIQSTGPTSGCEVEEGHNTKHLVGEPPSLCECGHHVGAHSYGTFSAQHGW